MSVRDHPGQGSRYSVCRVWVPSSLSEVQACLPVLIRSSLSLLPFLLSTSFFSDRSIGSLWRAHHLHPDTSDSVHDCHFSLPGPFLQLAEVTCVLGFLSREGRDRQSPRDTLGYHLVTHQNIPLFCKLFCSGQVRTRLWGTAVSWDKVKTVTLDFGSDTSLCVVLWGVSVPCLPQYTPYWLLSSSLVKWQDSLITQMGHQNFNIEQETKLPRSGSVRQNSPKSVKGKGYWVPAPHPPSPLRLWSRKPGRFPRCQKPVNNH